MITNEIVIMSNHQEIIEEAIEDGAVDTAAAAAAKANSTNNKKKRGPKITPTEDILIFKAWIAASEDAKTGVSQKGDVFKTSVYANYVYLLKKYNTSHGTRYYVDRGKDSIMNRFKKLSKYVMKYIGIEETTDKPSGDNALEEYERLCRETFLARYPTEATILENVIACKEIVIDKPKWKKYQTDEDEKADKPDEKPKRPTGSKKAKQLKQDIDLAKKLLGQEEIVIIDGDDDSGERKTTATKSQLMFQHQKKKEAFMDKFGSSLESAVSGK